MEASRASGLGTGVGLRDEHVGYILDHFPKVPWFEAISENYLGIRRVSARGRPVIDRGGLRIEALELLRDRYPISLHGVSLSIGSTDPLDRLFLDRLVELIAILDPLLVSDHLCWSGVGGRVSHDLLPLPYTHRVLDHVSRRVERVQKRLRRPLMLENVSAYLTYKHMEMSEWEFIARLVDRTGCMVLLDVNNVYVSATNLGFDAHEYVDAIPRGSVAQFHLAGHTRHGAYLIDTHTGHAIRPVIELFQYAVRRFGDVPAIIEWDSKIPAFETLFSESKRLERFRRQSLRRTHAKRAEAPRVGKAPKAIAGLD